VFDDRQASADAQMSDQERLDQVSSQNEEISTTIIQLQTTYETMQATFADRKESYDQSLAAYNDQVRQVNDRGGATESEFATLTQTQQTLERESQTLRRLADELNDVATQLNELSTESNRLVQTYNQQVEAYNYQYGGGEKFTQGDYTGKEIHIYKFSDQTELVTVLAHEFGHALGIGHVDGSGSLMYYLLAEAEDQIPALSPSDLEAYNITCQTDSWDFKLRSIIRSIIS
jgi:DNA repair exonuclease SbcCD ATPase subunit